jgi:hypothetical protein
MEECIAIKARKEEGVWAEETDPLIITAKGTRVRGAGLETGGCGLEYGREACISRQAFRSKICGLVKPVTEL